jgi:hypothetical protein
MALIFLSYSRDTDAALAHLLETELTNRGHAVCLDVRILPGGDFVEGIKLVLESANSVVVILSEGVVGENSEYQALEVQLALDYKKLIVPVIPPDFDWNAAAIEAPWIRSIQTFNDAVVSYDYREAFVDRVVRFAAPVKPPQIEPRIPVSLGSRLGLKPWWKIW